MKKLFLLFVLGMNLVLIGGEKPKALVIMLDGVRSDALAAAGAPNLDRLRTGTWSPGYRGSYSECAHPIHDANPNSGPNHAAIATGVTAEKHRVFSNKDVAQGAYNTWPSFPVRLKQARPELQTLFVYGWKNSGAIVPASQVEQFRLGSDEKNCLELTKRLAVPDGPDAVLCYIDLPDLAGHKHGFYPWSNPYLAAIAQCDQWIGMMLAAIAGRPDFAKEDWLIMVTSDHGGYDLRHGARDGHSSTIPLIAAGRRIAAGRFPGRPANYDVAATALAHFGLEPQKMALDGVVLGGNAVPVKTDEMPSAPVIALAGTIPNNTVIPDSKTLPVSEFTMTMRVKLPADMQGDPVLIANKSWHNGKLPGFVLHGSRHKQNRRFGVKFSYARRSVPARRADLGQFDMVPGKWYSLAISLTPEGVLYFCCMDDGRFYFLAESAGDADLKTDFAWRIGQDGTGKYRFGFAGEVADFAFYSRGMEVETLRRLLAQPSSAVVAAKPNETSRNN